MKRRHTINANVEWEISSLATGEWMGVCDELGLTLVADSQPELHETIFSSMRELIHDLVTDGILEKFCREHGWLLVTKDGDLPKDPNEYDFGYPVKFAPANVMPVAHAS